MREECYWTHKLPNTPAFGGLSGMEMHQQ